MDVYKFLICFVFFVILVHCDQKKSRLIIQTKNGLLRGRQNTTVGLNMTYYAYQGIPYSEPPIGKLRFEPPVPKKNWKGILDAIEDGNKCIQGYPAEGDEDCLFLNVYVPKFSKYNKKLLPTMVFIYGGGFDMGSADYELYGPDYILERGVVVVTFNYRLGILGFLSTGDLVAPGNIGLKDQVMALKWVKDNIENFGGDPNQVTIFGESAGSASVSYQMQSPQSRGLFHRAILESGVSLSPWALSRKVPEVIKKVAKEFSIDTSSSQKMVDELRKINASVLHEKAATTVVFQYLTNDPRYGLMLGPVIEPNHNNAFFTKKSHQLLSEGDFNKVPCIIGFNSLEAAFDESVYSLLKIYFLQYDLDHTRLLPVDLNIQESKKSTAAEYIKKYYFGDDIIAFSDRKLMTYLSDDLFVRPTREYVRLVSKHVPVYFYIFSYEGNLGGVINRPAPGVSHAEEMGYLWRSRFAPNNQMDIVTRKRMTTMWTDFAKTGNPTPKKYLTNLEVRVTWEKTDANFTYLDIGSELKLKQFPEKSNMELWDKIYDVYGRPPYDTY